MALGPRHLGAVKTLLELAIGLILGTLVAWLGQRGGLLTKSGLVAVVGLTALTFGLAGWTWGVLLLAYWLGTGLWARYGASYKRGLGDRFTTGSRRSWRQILAALGWGAALVVLHRLAPANMGILAAFVGAIATATADVWATELGVLNAKPPRVLTSRRSVPAGTPGAISPLGTVAAVAGAWLVGFLGLFLPAIGAWIKGQSWPRPLLWLPISATIGGVAGCLVDSFLGATAQGVYYCERCEKLCENRWHSCGEQAQQVRGWSWLTNDGINLVSTVVGAAITAGCVAWLAQTIIWW